MTPSDVQKTVTMQQEQRTTEEDMAQDEAAQVGNDELIKIPVFHARERPSNHVSDGTNGWFRKGIVQLHEKWVGGKSSKRHLLVS